MVTAPVLLLLYDRTFVAGTWRAALRARAVFFLALAGTWLLLAALMRGTGNRGGSIGFGIGIDWWAYALTQFHAVARYLALALWPRAQIFDYGTYWVRRAGEVVPYALVVLALLGATLWALRRRPALGFLGCWFFVILAPTSSIVPGTTQMIVEHRMYLPLAAVTVLGAALLARSRAPPEGGGRRRSLARGWRRRALGLTLGTATRSIAATLALWQDTVAKRPDYARAHNNLGAASSWPRSRTDEAMAEFPQDPRRSIPLMPRGAQQSRHRAPAGRAGGGRDRPIRRGPAAPLGLPEGAEESRDRARRRGPSPRGDHAVRGGAAAQSRLRPRRTTPWATRCSSWASPGRRPRNSPRRSA